MIVPILLATCLGFAATMGYAADYLRLAANSEKGCEVIVRAQKELVKIETYKVSQARQHRYVSFTDKEIALLSSDAQNRYAVGLQGAQSPKYSGRCARLLNTLLCLTCACAACPSCRA